MAYADLKRIATFDLYRKQHSQDATLWMRLFMLAANEPHEPPAECSDILSILRYVRGTGTTLEKHSKFGYIMRPVIGADCWESKEEWEREKQYMMPHHKQIAAWLKKIAEV